MAFWVSHSQSRTVCDIGIPANPEPMLDWSSKLWWRCSCLALSQVLLGKIRQSWSWATYPAFPLPSAWPPWWGCHLGVRKEAYLLPSLLLWQGTHFYLHRTCPNSTFLRSKRWCEQWKCIWAAFEASWSSCLVCVHVLLFHQMMGRKVKRAQLETTARNSKIL